MIILAELIARIKPEILCHCVTYCLTYQTIYENSISTSSFNKINKHYCLPISTMITIYFQNITCSLRELLLSSVETSGMFFAAV